MLDITQLNHSLLTPPAPVTAKPGTNGRTFPDGVAALRMVPLNAKPTVTWRVTGACNQHCLNCLSDAWPRRTGPELTTEEGEALVRDLAAFGVPRLVFAGGEPLLRPDLLEWVAYSREQDVEPSLLTNGTLLTPAIAAELKRAGLHSVTILMEGFGREVDRHRGVRGAGQAVMDGYASCEAAGLPTEIRMPLTRWNYPRLAETLDAIESCAIRRVVFTHMVYAGRGNRPEEDLSREEKRGALDLILERAEDFQRRGVDIQIATDHNHADGVYFWLRVARKDPWRAVAALRLLPAYGADVQGAGVGMAGIDPAGDVHPEIHWSQHSLGNVRNAAFSEIWEKSPDPLLRGLRDRLPLLTGRCANCRWKGICGGNLRVRAEQYYGDPWTSDPACYLTNNEIAKDVTERAEAMEDDVLLREQAA